MTDLNMLLSCFREKMSGQTRRRETRPREEGGETDGHERKLERRATDIFRVKTPAADGGTTSLPKPRPLGPISAFWVDIKCIGHHFHTLNKCGMSSTEPHYEVGSKVRDIARTTYKDAL